MDSTLPLTYEGDLVGVTGFAKELLMGDARTGVERDFIIGKDADTTTANILTVWPTYEASDAPSLWVMYGGVRRLVHRKKGRVGFTPFAKEHLLFPTGHAMDVKNRVYVLGGQRDGKRIRDEVKTTLILAWNRYVTDDNYTHVWVKWKDGTRRLVHRKGL